ncbi:DUF2752 domain-containing protein [Saccharicrinis sp. FJH54]|uniref:DUF2752 domain-containing protein n=1 Tax=Saccharicrinis sp. FJH54 TaxID=3344665 RepID=UPI0035D517BE
MKSNKLTKIRNRSIGTGMVLSALFYLYYPFLSFHSKETLYLDGCIFKSVTHLPCPGCGYDRAMNQLVRNNWSEAFHYNALFPFLILLSLFILVAGIKITLSGKLFSISKTTLYIILGLVIASWIMKFIMGPLYY